MNYDISPHVKPSITKGSYDSWQYYLSIQFNLFREDFVAPLRRGISNYINGKEFPDVRIYQQATFTGMALNEDGVLLSVKFKADDTSTSTSLINGTLLCFSSDNFKTILFATVANQKEENQTEEFSNLERYPIDQVIQIQVKIESDVDNLSLLGINENGYITNSQTYTIIQSPAHYETYYHVLSSLQNAEPQKMPFTECLIDYRPKIRQPKIRRPMYLSQIRRCHFNMTEVLKLKGDSSRGCFDIINKACWPSHNIEGLDESQVKALQLALAHEVALIQGPPGTGKTYIGSKIMEALLINKDTWDPNGDSPILVVCYTNQALDQFFEKIIEIKSKQANNRLYYHGGLDKELKCNPREIVRIGGGCSETVSDYSFNNFKSIDWRKELNKKGTKMKFVIDDKHTNYLNIQKGKIEKLNKKINRKIQLFSNPPPIKDLSEFIDPLHFSQLEDMHECPDQCIKAWLQGKHYKMTNSTASVKKNKVGASRQSTSKQLFSKSIFVPPKCNSMQYNSCYAMKYQQLACYTKVEVQSIDDINSLSRNERIKLHNFWIKQFRHHQYSEICNLIDEYNKIHENFIDSQQRKNIEMLQKVHVICMTTTKAAKSKRLLEELKPKIVIAEEAAEVFESHIIACLMAATEHLILIGDHKQLRPNPSEHLLERCHYGLHISLFERLINNGIPRVTLKTQHRMRPEIADLIRTNVYSSCKLKDHISAQKYDNIKGITTNMYFFDHKYPEKWIKSTKSYSNKEEGIFIAKLCGYLLKHYKPSEITVLSAYGSQVRLLKEQIQLIESEDFDEVDYNIVSKEYVKIKTIDNYQGEENKIIILSLVRSNEEDNIGFLKYENRTCVALSRAKEGLYCFGNFTLFSDKSVLWKKIITDLQGENKVGSVLQLCCVNHQLSITNITKSKDFEKVPHGGCWRQCNAYLDCGHKCKLKCHIIDRDHKNYQCKETCLNKCKNCGTPCKHKCHIDCSSQRCETLVVKTIPKCNHNQFVPCYMKSEKFRCQEKCNKTCLRGHPCNLTCSEECKPCMKEKTKVLTCGHKVTLFCSENYAIPDCIAPCYKTCTTNIQNPHKCTKRCSDICGDCEAMVEVIMPWCGHSQQVPCYMQHNLNAFANRISCTTMIETIFPTCGHSAAIPCGKNIDDYFCYRLVEVKLPCGHNKDIECYKTTTQGVNKKVTLASEKCFVNTRKTFGKCKHVIDLPCHNSDLRECPVKCNTVLLCGHRCSGTCHECHQGRLHKPCMFHVSKLLCGHETTMNCSSVIIEPYPSCSYRCERFCPHKKCSHKCQDTCEPCHRPCNWQCPHYMCTRKCYERCNRQRCYHPCPHLKRCRHRCIGVCGEHCPDVCKICDKERFLQLYVSLDRFKTKDDTTYIQLDCGHLFKRTELDPWVDARSKQFQLISCPKCNQTIHLRRYGNAIKATYNGIKEIMDTMDESLTIEVKLEALMIYHITIKNAMEVLGLLNFEALLQGLSYEELEQFVMASDKELEQFAAACSNNTNTKFCPGIKIFIENKKENYLSAINVITDMLNSILSLLKFSQENLDIANSLETLLKFTMESHSSLSLQVIQDVTREQKRLALWIMADQVKNEISDHTDLQSVKQVENVLLIGRFCNKPLLPQQAKKLYFKLSKIVMKYGTKLLDKKYISTPKLPLFYTGVWKQCDKDHYYCVPQQVPGVSCDFLIDQGCPQCEENDTDTDTEYMDTVNIFR